MTESAEPQVAAGRPRTRAAFWVGAGIFLSRLVGFARERAFAYFFGASDYADAWRAATRAPNIIQNLLGEGTLSASFIPIYAELLEEGREEEAGRFAGAALGLLMLAVWAVVLVGILLAPLLVPLMFFRWTPEKQELTVQLVQVLLPMTGVLVVSAWAVGVLNSHRRFFVSYIAPAFWSLTLIVTLVVFGGTLAFGPERLVMTLAIGGVVGSLVQLGVQLPFVAAVLRHFRLSVSRAVFGVREAIANLVPVIAARGVVNVSAYIDLILAGILASGAVAILGYAQTLYILPISLFGMSVAASELPELSRQRRDAAHVLAGRVSSSMTTLAWFLIPSTLGYVALGDVIVGALFQTGAFGVAETPCDPRGPGRVRPGPDGVGSVPAAVVRLLRPSRYPDSGQRGLRACRSVPRGGSLGHAAAGRDLHGRPAAGCRGAGPGCRRGRLGGIRHAAQGPDPRNGRARTRSDPHGTHLDRRRYRHCRRARDQGIAPRSPPGSRGRWNAHGVRGSVPRRYAQSWRPHSDGTRGGLTSNTPRAPGPPPRVVPEPRPTLHSPRCLPVS